MLQPVKAAFGEYMGGFDASISANHQGIVGEVRHARLAKSVVWAPSRMIDAAEDMLSSWQRNDTDSTATKPANMPVIIVAMAKDYTPTGRDFTRQVAESVMVMIPGDDRRSAFSAFYRPVAGDIRAQVCNLRP